MRRVQRDTDADFDLKEVSLDQKRLLERCTQATEATCRALASSAGERNTANSSPPSRATVTVGANRLTQAHPHLLEQLIAELMTEGIVDLLEAVEIEHEQGHPAPHLFGHRKCFRDTS